MTVYSRSDLAAISLSPAHGGCGATHARPAPGGKPIPVWQLTCPKCEDFLRADPLWGATSGTIPETPDETQAREAAEGRTQREQLTNNVDALSRIGDALTILAQSHNSQSSETSQVLGMLTAVLAQNGLLVPQGATQAPVEAAPPTGAPEALTDAQVAELQAAMNTLNDDPAWEHKVVAQVAGGLRSIDDARAELRGDEPPEGAGVPGRPDGPQDQPPTGRFGIPDLDAMNMPALNSYAKSLGLPGRRSRAEQLEAIRDHLGM